MNDGGGANIICVAFHGYDSAMQTMSERLRHARITAGFESASAAARKLGMSTTTYLAHENGQNEFKNKHAVRYANVFGVSAGWLLTGDKSDSFNKPHNQKIINIPIRGRVQAGSWVEPAPEVAMGNLAFSISNDTDNADYFALRVDGDSLNKKAPDGSTLICRAIRSVDVDVRNNDLVVVKRTRADGLREYTAKRFRRIPGGFELAPESTDPRWQKPARYLATDRPSDIQIEIVAVVTTIMIEP